VSVNFVVAGTGDAPTIRYDPDEGYYYSIGGGWITNGPARSRSLKNWTVSPLAPMAVPDTRAALANLPASVMDTAAGLNTKMYTAIWAKGIPPGVEAWAHNLSSWNWGATDPDLCCDDGKAPSFLVNCLSRQGAPSSFHGKTYGFSRLRTSPLPLNEWLRSYFPGPNTPTPPPGPLTPTPPPTPSPIPGAYTALADEMGPDSAELAQVKCDSPAACGKICDATVGCFSFASSPHWAGGGRAKLYNTTGRGVGMLSWTLYSKKHTPTSWQVG
jgi:hypothetical protein